MTKRVKSANHGQLRHYLVKPPTSAPLWGKRCVTMSDLLPKNAPIRALLRAEHPVHEIENIDIDPAEKHGNWLDERGMVKKTHMPGYLVNNLDIARDRFAEFYGITCNLPDEQ